MNSRERTARGVGLAMSLAFMVFGGAIGCVQGANHEGTGGSSGGGIGGGTAGTTGGGSGGTTGSSGGSTGSSGGMTGGGSGGTTTSSGGHTGTAGSGSGGMTTSSGGAPGSGGHIFSADAGSRPDLTGKKALFIVSSTSSPDDGEALVLQLLQLRGLDVTLGDESSPASMATGFAMVVLSSNVTNAVPVFAPVPVPVVVFGNTSFYQPMGFVTSSSGRGNVTGAQATVTDTTTLLSSDLTQGQMIDVFNAALGNSQYTWGIPGGAPIKVATVVGMPTEMVVFGYEKGAAMATGTAAGRRVSLGWKSGNVKLLTVESFKLQDGAFSWAAGGM